MNILDGVATFDFGRSAIVDSTVTGANAWTDNALLANYVDGGTATLYGVMTTNIIKSVSNCESTVTSAPSSEPTIEWIQQLGSSGVDSGSDLARDITSDNNGNVYVTGYIYGDLDGNTSAGSDDLFTAKYDSSGVKQFANNGLEMGREIVTDSSGNIYVLGGYVDSFIIKYNSSGAKQWTQQLGSNDFAYGIATDNNGNIYVTGGTSGSLDGNTNAGGNDLFVIKYDSSGVKQWTQQLGGVSSYESGIGIATDGSGNVYIGSSFQGGALHSVADSTFKFFVFKYNNSGVMQWVQQYRSNDDLEMFDITTDSSGNVYVMGNGSLDGNTSDGPVAGFNSDIFVIKYDSFGLKQWTKQMGFSSYEEPTGITMDSSGNIYVTGGTYGSLDGITNANGEGGRDVFVVKLSQ